MIRVTSSRYVSGYSVWLRFSDGSEGTIDLREELFGEIFEPLRDINEFKKVTLNSELGTIVWPNGADFAPAFLRKQLKSAA